MAAAAGLSIAPLLRPAPLFLIASALRIALLLYGTWQDAHSALKLLLLGVVALPARHVPLHPLLAWLLLPTTLAPQWLFFSFGKVVFALADLLAGWLILRVLLGSSSGGSGGTSIRPAGRVPEPSSSQQQQQQQAMTPERAGAFAALWLWNPMVATISTRGSSEGLLGVLTVALLWAIYPFIYAPAIVWWMDDEHMGVISRKPSSKAGVQSSVGATTLLRFCSAARIRLALVSLATFMGLNVLMYSIYGSPFIVHTFLHHLTRIDHRHNFSPYNVLLYLTSANPPAAAAWHVESLAFVPQLLLSCVLIPFVLAKKDLATSMMAQTFAFVTFNKVCTSQYFLWYMIFLPLYLPRSSLLRNPKLGVTALVLWVASQGAWLQQGYELEFLGKSTFFPGLWLSSLGFFLVNCWILGIIISDGVAQRSISPSRKAHVE
ncbi:hypothetical protein ACCO45_006614 [Purpureocillium lilacinum]|uniref:Uncharacterized protein n=1 Tax=Purpureocillium lilacinum TaxID=33203 RepID=A0ACC4DQU7_PURLI